MDVVLSKGLWSFVGRSYSLRENWKLPGSSFTQNNLKLEGNRLEIPSTKVGLHSTIAFELPHVTITNPPSPQTPSAAIVYLFCMFRSSRNPRRFHAGSTHTHGVFSEVHCTGGTSQLCMAISSLFTVNKKRQKIDCN
jgi:hypothetical protein